MIYIVILSSMIFYKEFVLCLASTNSILTISRNVNNHQELAFILSGTSFTFLNTSQFYYSLNLSFFVFLKPFLKSKRLI